MTDTITMSREFLDEIIFYCKEIYPDEACGLLAGKTGSVEKIYKITNIRHSSFNYEMDAIEQLRCEKTIRKAGLKIIGIYHSHPTSSAYPSQLDIMRVYWPGDPDMPIYPDACHVIVGLIGGVTEVKAFMINSRQKISEIKLNII